MDEQQFKARISQIHQDLPAYSYYELLNLEQTATSEQIRQAFHRMALSMHPDRYQQSPDKELKRQLYAIYKRVSEGYRVLGSSATRREYDEALGRGERRLVQKERKQSGPKRADQGIKNPQARKFFSLGQDAERRGDPKNARINYKFALDLEDNPTIAQKFAQLEAESGSDKK